MLDYEILRFLWWAILGLLLIGFAVTDGYDLGMGILLRFIAKTDAERRQAIATVEPVWEGNQVWFVLGGGAAFAAWPMLYAASFSGFYVAMLVVLAALILRPVAFNFRDKLTEPQWRDAWDWALFISGFVPALIFGVAFGNLLRGVPFHLEPDLRPVYDGSFFGLLNPFALLAGLVSVAMLAMHGGAWIALKSDGTVAGRARRASSTAGWITLVLFALAGLWVVLALPGFEISGAIAHDGPSNPLMKTVVVAPGAWLANYHHFPLSIAAPILGLAGALLAALFARAGRDLLAFLSSALGIAGIIATPGLAMFPFLFPSATDPKSSLTVWDASSSRMTLFIMLIVTIIFLPIVLFYTGWVLRILRGRVRSGEQHEGY
jgi:cytochrome bd ubiquinol oxidase subunit II